MSGGCIGSKKYVGWKVNKVRFQPSTSHYKPSDTFISGSWNDYENTLCLWRLPESEDDPILLQQLSHRGSVNDIQYISSDVFATGSSDGCVKIYQHSNTGTGTGQIQHKMSWDNVHSFVSGNAPCTAVASNGDQIASVGEDGRLVVMTPTHNTPINSLESVGGCSMYAVVYIRASEVLTGSMQGHLKLWDLRAQQPVKATLHSPDQVGVCTVSSHPTQQHIVAVGGEDGALAIWDMRYTTHPFTIIAAHDAPISEVRFHPTCPDHLFTCGVDGQVLHFDGSASTNPSCITSYRATREQPGGGSVAVWLSSDAARGSINTISIIPTSPLPINSIDVHASTVIAASDNDAIHTIRQVLLY